MDRHSNAGEPPWHAGAKNIRLRLDRGCPKPRRYVEPGQGSAEIVGERCQRTAMHMAAVVEMTIIDIEFAYELILVSVGNADAEVSRHTGTGRSRGHRRAPNSRQEQRTILTASEAARGADIWLSFRRGQSEFRSLLLGERPDDGSVRRRPSSQKSGRHLGSQEEVAHLMQIASNEGAEPSDFVS